MASILSPSNSPGNDSLIGSPDKNQELASSSNVNSTPINLPNFSVKNSLFKVIYVWGGIWHYWNLISEKAWIQSHFDSHGSDYLSGCPDENQELSEYVIELSCCSGNVNNYLWVSTNNQESSYYKVPVIKFYKAKVCIAIYIADVYNRAVHLQIFDQGLIDHK